MNASSRSKLAALALCLLGALPQQARPAAADLVVHLTDSPDPVVLGQALTYTATVSNAGPDTVSGVAATLSLPYAALLVSATPSHGAVETGGPGDDLRWQIGVQTNGSAATLVVTVRPYDADGNLRATLGVSQGDTELDSENDSVMELTTPLDGPGVLHFESTSLGLAESAGTREVAVIRSGGAQGAVTVSYASVNGAAAAPGDFTHAAGVLTFADGETYQTFALTVNDDTEAECNERFQLALFDATEGALLLFDTNATVTIFDEDTAASGALGCVTEAAAGAQTANGLSSWRGVSADGRQVAFMCSGNNLVTNPLTSGAQIFLRDTASNTIRLVTRSLSGTAGANAASRNTSISDDGAVVAYLSSASNLHPRVTNFTMAIYAWHRLTESNVLVSLNLAGTGPSTGGIGA